MGGLVARALIMFWERNRTRAAPAVLAIAGAIPAAMTAFANYLWSDSRYPAGEMHNSWDKGGIRQINYAYTDEWIAPMTGQVVQSVGSNARTTFIGPSSLSCAVDHFKWSRVNFDD